MFQFDVTSLLVGGSTSPCGSSSAAIATLNGVQRANFNLTWPRQDIVAWDGAGSQEMIDRPRADLAFSYLFDGSGLAERSLGFLTSLGGFAPALTDLITDERNYYLVANLDYLDQIGYSSRNERVLALGNAAITHYDFTAQVGQPSLVNVTVQGLNLLVQASGTGILPTVDKQVGTAATSAYSLPVASQTITNYFSAAPSAIQLTFNTGSAMGLLLSGANACPVQTFSFSLDMPRRDVRELGWAYPDTRPIQWPVNIGIRADVVLNAFQLDSLNRYGCPDSGYAFSVGFKSDCSNMQDFSYRFEGAKLENESLGLSVGGGPANASLSWSVHLNDINRAGAGLPGFYIDTLDVPVGAVGGTESLVNGRYKLHTFTSSGFLLVTTGGLVDMLVAAAGGGGGGGGGGGAGGFKKVNSYYLSTGLYAVQVGVGGSGTANTANYGGNGGPSSIASLTVSGGGGGGGASAPFPNYAGRDGGCGGGAGATVAGTAGGGFGITGQGFDGADTTAYPNYYGGGGGAGSKGSEGSSAFGPDQGHGGAGGDGVYDDIGGVCEPYCGGGGAAGNTAGGAGGSNIGGNGSSATTPTTSPTANRGGGGGGGFTYPSTAGADGIVMIRYRVPPN